MQNIVRLLNNLVHLDVDAIKAYESAIERVDDPETKRELTRFKRDHDRHVDEVRRLVFELGGEPVNRADFKRVLTQGRVVLQSIWGDRGILEAMKSNADQTNRKYEDALKVEGLPDEVTRVLQDILSDERRHRAWIVARLERGFQRTGSATECIEVDRDIHTVYERWTRFEEFPRFMSGVKEVERVGRRDVRFVVDVAGHQMEYVAEITDTVEDQRVAWSSREGRQTGGIVTFEEVGPNRTRVELFLSYEPKGTLERLADLQGAVGTQARTDLRNFKQYVERREG